MPLFKLSAVDCETLVYGLNGIVGNEASGLLGSTFRSDNQRFAEALMHLRDALAVAVVNKFDATLIREILDRAEKGFITSTPDERPYVKRLVDCGYLSSAGVDSNGDSIVNGLHEAAGPLRQLLLWEGYPTT